MSPNPILSVVIVNYKVRDLLAQAIRSVQVADAYASCEIIVIDNNSEDAAKERILCEFPDVLWIGLEVNAGFGKACNIGTQSARGRILLMLNPDTIISKDTLRIGIEYMDSHPNVGIMGPKILNQDGSFQYQCRRNFPTPLSAFTYITGFSKLFPKSHFWGQYLLTWVSIDQKRDVDAISGACFFIPRKLYQEIGGFDERFFMYGEDLDICAQVASAGFRVRYVPTTEILHFKGRSSAQKQLQSRIRFYEAMVLFSRKHKNNQTPRFIHSLLYVGICIQGAINIAGTLIKIGATNISAVWHSLLSPFSQKKSEYTKTVLFTDNSSLTTILASAHSLNKNDIIGVVSPTKPTNAEYPYLGDLSQLDDILQKYRPKTFVIASNTNWYTIILKALSEGTFKGITILWSPTESETKATFT